VSYLLDLLRTAARDLAEAEKPTVEEVRGVLGGLVSRVEELERYLGELTQSKTSGTAEEPAAEHEAPAAASEPAATTGPEPAPATEPPPAAAPDSDHPPAEESHPFSPSSNVSSEV
jgi:hypothetical protein